MNRGLAVMTDRTILGKDFSIYGTPEDPYFLARDIAEFLGHNQPSKLVELVDEDEKRVIIVNTDRGPQRRWVLTESGLYEVLMHSRKNVARVFRREVKGILREIRRNGLYVGEKRLNDMLDNPDFAIELLKKIKASRDEVRSLSKTIVMQRPKVVFADAVSEAETTIMVGDLAKIIRQNGVEIGQNRLFAWLRKNEFLSKRKGATYNTPTQRAMEMEFFRIYECLRRRKDGRREVRKIVRVTGKGQVYFINRFVKGM